MSKKPLVDFTPAGASGDHEIGHQVLQRYAASLRESSPNFDLGSMQVTGSTGIDALFSREPHMITPRGSKVRVASIQQLEGFHRLSADMLIHKSDRDLWAIRKDAEGSLLIERMFDDDGKPLRG